MTLEHRLFFVTLYLLSRVAHSGAFIQPYLNLQAEVEVFPANWQGIGPISSIVTLCCHEKYLQQISADKCTYWHLICELILNGQKTLGMSHFSRACGRWIRQFVITAAHRRLSRLQALQNATEKSALFSLCLEDSSALFFTAHPIPRFIVYQPKISLSIRRDSANTSDSYT